MWGIIYINRTRLNYKISQFFVVVVVGKASLFLTNWLKKTLVFFYYLNNKYNTKTSQAQKKKHFNLV